MWKSYVERYLDYNAKLKGFVPFYNRQCIVCMDAIGQEGRSEMRNIFVRICWGFCLTLKNRLFKSQTMQFSFFKTINYFNISCILQGATFMVNPMFTRKSEVKKNPFNWSFLWLSIAQMRSLGKCFVYVMFLCHLRFQNR